MGFCLLSSAGSLCRLAQAEAFDLSCRCNRARAVLYVIFKAASSRFPEDPSHRIPLPWIGNACPPGPIRLLFLLAFHDEINRKTRAFAARVSIAFLFDPSHLFHVADLYSFLLFDCHG
jgi:hypothetical protein